MAGGTGSSYPKQRKTERSRRGTPCCTYRCCLWLLAGCVRVLGIRKTVFEKWHGNCLSGLVTSTRLGRGSIKSHVRTVKVLGMGLFVSGSGTPLSRCNTLDFVPKSCAKGAAPLWNPCLHRLWAMWIRRTESSLTKAHPAVCGEEKALLRKCNNPL